MLLRRDDFATRFVVKERADLGLDLAELDTFAPSSNRRFQLVKRDSELSARRGGDLGARNKRSEGAQVASNAYAPLEARLKWDGSNPTKGIKDDVSW